MRICGGIRKEMKSMAQNRSRRRPAVRLIRLRQSGSVGELMTAGILVLAMMVLMLSYLDSVELLSRKEEVNQLARKYILRMETVGYLNETDRDALEAELGRIGVTGLDLSGTTLIEAGYGSPITLQLRGELPGKGIRYPFVEKRTSTAKN